MSGEFEAVRPSFRRRERVPLQQAVAQAEVVPDSQDFLLRHWAGVVTAIVFVPNQRVAGDTWYSRGS